MKFMAITDIHYWSDCNYPNIKWPEYINTFWNILVSEREKINRIISNENIDFIMNLWDLIRETKNFIFDSELYRDWLNLLNSFWLPVYNVAWNHDVDHDMSRESIAEINWYERMYYKFELWWYTHIILDGNREWKVNWEIVLWQKYSFDNKQLQWLEDVLMQSELDCIIYCHFPIDDQDISNNPYWPTWDTTRVFPQNYEKVRKMIEDSKKVIAYFNWHTHFPHISLINWILHCNIGSFSENNWFWNPTNELAVIEVKDKDIRVSFRKL